MSGGYGYSYYPNTFITFSTETNGANAIVGSLAPIGIANVAMIPVDTIGLKKDIVLSSNYAFSNFASSNANTTLLSAFSFTTFTTYPISSVLVKNGGSGIKQEPEVQAYGGYQSDLIVYGSNTANTPLLSSLGILAPIQISDGGTGYQNNDIILFSGGSGQGAHANVEVDANGTITHAYYVEDTLRRFPLGGFGYRATDLPSLTVQSANGSNSSLYVTGILGEGAVLKAVTDNAGEVVTIKIIDYGEDYISTPSVSLKVQDILVSNVALNNLPQKGDSIVQGANINVATYIATVNSVSVLSVDSNPENSIWNLRVFNYNSLPDPSKILYIQSKEINMVMANTAYAANTFYPGSPKYDSTGVKTYGDGTAKATAKFLNGLVISEGQYLDSRGQPSSFSVLQNEIYNNYTYQITVQKEIDKYRSTLLNLLHPSGMRLIGRYALKSNSNINFKTTDALFTGVPLYYYTGTDPHVIMTTDFVNKSNNIITFDNMPNSDPPVLLSDFLVPGSSRIAITPTNGYNIDAKIVSIDDTSNTAVLDTYTWLTFGNVAIASTQAGSNAINITSFTGQYDLINNGNYLDPENKLQDIVFVGDTVSINNEIKIVDSVVGNTIYVSSNMTNDADDYYLSVKRNFIANTDSQYDQVKIFGPIGQQYDNPELLTEDGIIITTEDGRILIVG